MLDSILYPLPSAPPLVASLSVSTLHNLTYSVYGKPDGPLALFLHGGPGAGCFPNHARFFDPEHYRVVLLDQRGCGRSTPKGETRENTLSDLVRDCETLLREVSSSSSSSRWEVVLGGSWGVALAVAYAQEYPNSVGALVLRGACLMRTKEIDWLFGDEGGTAKTNPEGWRTFAAPTTERSAAFSADDEMDDRRTLHAYYDRLLSSDPKIRLSAAKRWFAWEMNVTASSYLPSASETKKDDDKDGSSAHMLAWDGRTWSFLDESDQETDVLENGDRVDVTAAVERLRRFPDSDDARERRDDDDGGSTATLDPPRPIAPLFPGTSKPKRPPSNSPFLRYPSYMSSNEKNAFVPAQAMLTCYYSVNNSPRNEVFGRDLLGPTRMSRLRSIPCVVVQGGNDRICPPDTALDFLRRHERPANVSVRMPLRAGHSMYDPAVARELVRATDSFKTSTTNEKARERRRANSGRRA